MSIGLNDKLKNEYSTQYVLVIDDDSFYPRATEIDEQSREEKISLSSVAGINYQIGGSAPPTKLDPFRQATGKLWTYVDDGVRFYDSFSNFVKNDGIHKSQYPSNYLGKSANPGISEIKCENVTGEWKDFFDADAYEGSLNLKRKATRMKIKFFSDDLLQNRLTMLSLVTDINKKNLEKAYTNIGGVTEDDLPQGSSSLTSELLELEGIPSEGIPGLIDKYEVIYEENKSFVSQGPWISYKAGEGYSQSDLYQIYLQNLWQTANIYVGKYEKYDEFDQDEIKGLIFSLINEYEASPDPFLDDKKGTSFLIEYFTQWLNTRIQTLKSQIESIKKEIDSSQADVAEYSRAFNAYLSFQPASIDYNYSSVLDKNNIDLNTTGYVYNYGNYGSLPEEDKFVFTNEWEGFSLNALNQAVKEGQLDSFYDTQKNTYSYDQRTLYRDSNFKMQLPMSPKAMSLVNTANKNELFVDIKPQYNYYSKFYEEGTKQKTFIDSTGNEANLSELELPLIYEVPLDQDGTPADENIIPLPTKFKFDKFGHSLLNCLYNSDPQADKGYNIILDQNSKDFLKKYEDIKTQFPFYINFEFKADDNKSFATLFNQTGMTNDIIKTWISNFFHSNTIGGTVAVNPEKGDPITTEGGFQGSGYYDPEDPEATYKQVFPGLFTAPICKDEIYKIANKKDFYKIVPPDETQDTDEANTSLVRETKSYNTREFDLNKWLDGYLKTIAKQGGSSSGDISYLSWQSEIIRNGSASTVLKTFSDSEDFFNSSNELEKTIKSVIFLGKYRQLVEQKARNYQDIIKKNLAYSETLFYRVQKVSVDQEGNPDESGLVQNFWLVRPNDKENETNSDIMKYIDTQVKYDQKYEYTVYAYQLVVGTKYGFQFENASQNLSIEPENFKNYSNKIQQSANNDGFQASLERLYIRGSQTKPRFNPFFMSKNKDIDDRLAIFDVVCEPDVKLIEMPFYKKVTSISDAASTAPEIDILPLNGKKNKIKINFYPSSVSRELVPVPIDFEDLIGYDKIRRNQNRFLLKQSPPKINGTIFQIMAQGFDPVEVLGLDPLLHVEPRLLFKTDDFAVQYEIYRTEKAPKQYIDFRDSLLAKIDAQKMSSFEDKIEQNKKYYYVFRSIDVHGNPSYPSPMYQVEMVENSGAVYPVISIYNPEQEQQGLKSKPFKRYLKIDASAMQGVLDIKNSGLENKDSALTNDNIYLGNKDKKLFNGSNSTSYKKFKFRIKSKHTGKTVDLNVSFKLRKQEPEEVLSCGEIISQKTKKVDMENVAEQNIDF